MTKIVFQLTVLFVNCFQNCSYLSVLATHFYLSIFIYISLREIHLLYPVIVFTRKYTRLYSDSVKNPKLSVKNQAASERTGQNATLMLELLMLTVESRHCALPQTATRFQKIKITTVTLKCIHKIPNQEFILILYILSFLRT